MTSLRDAYKLVKESNPTMFIAGGLEFKDRYDFFVRKEKQIGPMGSFLLVTTVIKETGEMVRDTLISPEASDPVKYKEYSTEELEQLLKEAP